MRRYAPQAAQDDPTAWRDMSGMYPTSRGTYRTSDYLLTTADKTATGETKTTYAFAAKTLTSNVSFVVGEKIWSYSGGAGGTLTDRTNSMAVGTSPKMAQYGNITICAMGAASGTPTIISTSGGAFSALGGGSPSAEHVCVLNNAVLLFNVYDGSNTYNDGWASSDIGDYSTWTPAAATNQAANGRLLDTNGPINGACVLGNNVYAFKADAIYRGTYVGRPLIWQWQLVHKGIGMKASAKNSLVSCGNMIAFMASGWNADSSGSPRVYLFDGINPPTCINEELYIPDLAYQFTYYSAEKTLYLPSPARAATNTPGRCWAYNITTGLWGVSEQLYGLGTAAATTAVDGEMGAVSDHFYAAYTIGSPVAWVYSTTDKLKLQYPVAPSSTPAGVTITPYVTSHRYGTADRKTTFRQVIPVLRERTAISGITGSATLTVNTYTERHDASTATTTTVAESAFRKRFDFMLTNTYAEFKMAFTNLDVEIDDLMVKAVDAGTD